MNKTYHWNRYFLSRDDPELTLLSPFSQISHNAASRYAIAILCESEREKEKKVCVNLEMMNSLHVHWQSKKLIY